MGVESLKSVARAWCARGALVGTLTLQACHGPVPAVWNLDARTAQPSPPLVTHGFIAFGHAAGVTVVDPAGATKCSFDAHGAVPSTPRTDGRLLYFGSTNHIFYAIDTDCKLQWKRATGGALAGAAEVTGDTVYIGSGDGHVYALQADNGAVRWMFPSAPVASVAAVAPPPAPLTPEQVRAAFRLQRAKLRWARRHRGESAMEAMSAMPEPPARAPAPAAPPGPAYKTKSFGHAAVVVVDGTLFAANADHKLYALDAATGSVRWTFESDSAVTTAPLLVHDVAYFGSANGDVYAVDLKTHKQVWKTAVSGQVTSSPRLFDQTLVVATAGRHLAGLDPGTGKARWDFATQGVVHHAPILYQGMLLASGGLGGGNVFAVRMQDSEVAWQAPVRGDTESTLAVSDQRLYVLTGSGGMTVFDLAEWSRPAT